MEKNHQTARAIRILVVSDETFDQLAFRRALRDEGVDGSVRLATHKQAWSEELKADLNEQASIVVLDYRRPTVEPERCAAWVLARTEIPVVGIFNSDDEARMIREIREGLECCVVTGAVFSAAVNMNLLAIRIAKVMRDKGLQGESGQQLARIAACHVEKQAILNASLTLISCHQPDTRILWSNASEEGDEPKVDYLAGRFAREIWKNGGIAGGGCPIATAIELGEPVEAEVTTLDGYTMLQRACPIFDQSGTVIGVMASTLDMSALSPAQEAMRTAARIQASATLAAGISHKFNNLMAGIMGNVSSAVFDLGDDHPAAHLLHEIEGAARTAGELSEQLLAFARGGRYLPRVISLNVVLEEALQLQTRHLPEQIDLQFRTEQNLWSVEANVHQMKHLFTQICNNAVEAIEEKAQGAPVAGTISITTENREIKDSRDSLTPWLKIGRHVVVTIRDTGIGMSPEVRARVFEPFFTTRGEGRGLGLAGVYGIVRSCDGHVFVESEKGVGTTFTVVLPATNAELFPVPPAHLAEVPVMPIQLPTGTETVLVVDDEDMLRRAIVRLLSRLGYQVLQAPSGDAAVELAKGHDGEIQVALLDMVMPGLDGMETYRRLKAQRPDMEIIVMSGYDRETYEKALLEAGAISFLQKPVPMDEIAREIRRVLD